MPTETQTQLASFIWSICNLLRGPYKRNEYRKVILPLTVLRRFDCMLAPTKAAVLEAHREIEAKGENIIRELIATMRSCPCFARRVKGPELDEIRLAGGSPSPRRAASRSASACRFNQT